MLQHIVASMHVRLDPGCHRRAPAGYARSALFGGRLLLLADAWGIAIPPSAMMHMFYCTVSRTVRVRHPPPGGRRERGRAAGRGQGGKRRSEICSNLRCRVT